MWVGAALVKLLVQRREQPRGMWGLALISAAIEVGLGSKCLGAQGHWRRDIPLATKLTPRPISHSNGGSFRVVAWQGGATPPSPFSLP